MGGHSYKPLHSSSFRSSYVSFRSRMALWLDSQEYFATTAKDSPVRTVAVEVVPRSVLLLLLLLLVSGCLMVPRVVGAKGHPQDQPWLAKGCSRLMRMLVEGVVGRRRVVAVHRREVVVVAEVEVEFELLTEFVMQLIQLLEKLYLVEG